MRAFKKRVLNIFFKNHRENGSFHIHTFAFDNGEMYYASTSSNILFSEPYYINYLLFILSIKLIGAISDKLRAPFIQSCRSEVNNEKISLQNEISGRKDSKSIQKRARAATKNFEENRETEERLFKRRSYSLGKALNFSEIFIQ